MGHVYDWWYDWWSLCTYYIIILIWLMMLVYFYIDEEWCEDTMYWVYVYIYIYIFKTIQHYKLFLNPITVNSAAFYTILLYKNMLHDSKTSTKMESKIKHLPRSHIFSHLFHTCFVALFRYIHLRSFPTVSLWGMAHELWTVPETSGWRGKNSLVTGY